MYDPAPDQPTLFAAGKAIEKLLGKATLEPGSHPVDCTINVKLFGVIEKAPEQHYQASASVPMPLMLTLLCQRAKLTRSEAKRMILECSEAAIGFGDALPERAGFGDRLRDTSDAIEEAIAAAPKADKKRAGATKWAGSATVEKAN